MNVVTISNRFGAISVNAKTLPHVLGVCLAVGVFAGVLIGVWGVLLMLK
jgi:hypothetical protein